MATTDRKVRFLHPSLQSMNEMLMEMVEYQVKKSAIRFWDDLNRMKLNPASFDQDWFASWKNQEVEKVNVDYLYGMFKRFVRSTIATEGMAATRTFPRLEVQNGMASFIPLGLSYSEWSDPALAFRDLATFTDTDMTGLWEGLNFTTTDLILQVIEFWLKNMILMR